MNISLKILKVVRGFHPGPHRHHGNRLISQPAMFLYFLLETCINTAKKVFSSKKYKFKKIVENLELTF